MKINYSIIIPHKNTPNLLQRCLDSIPRQDDVEVIVVDDNSDSAIVDFDRFPGEERDDVSIIFDKSNKGPGTARNIGIKKARGHWIVFIDSDDYFNYCLKDILSEYNEDGSDIVYFSASNVDSDTYTNSNRADDFVNLVENYIKDKTTGELGLRYVLASPWGKLIKKSLLIDNNIVFPDVLICEDVKFSYLLGFYAKEIKADKRALCCYTSRAISRSSVLSEEVFLDKIRVYAERDKFLMGNGILLPYGSFYIDALVDLGKKNNKVLYKKVIEVIIECGISQEQIDSLIGLEKKAREKKTRGLLGIKRVAHAVKNIIKKVLRGV